MRSCVRTWFCPISRVGATACVISPSLLGVPSTLYTGMGVGSRVALRPAFSTSLRLMNDPVAPESMSAVVVCPTSFDRIVRGICMDCAFISATSTELIEMRGDCLVGSRLLTENPRGALPPVAVLRSCLRGLVREPRLGCWW